MQIEKEIVYKCERWMITKQESNDVFVIRSIPDNQDHEEIIICNLSDIHTLIALLKEIV